MTTIIAGQSPPSSTYRKTPEGMPFFQGKADFGDRHPTPTTWCVAPKKVAQPGDILMSVRAPVGPTNVADVECCIGRGLAAIRCSKDIDRDYVLAYLKMIEEEIAREGSGSTFSAISRKQLCATQLPLPPLAEQRRIAARLNEQMTHIARARAAAEERLEAACALPPAWIREAFGGILPLTIDTTCDTSPPGWRWIRLTDVARLESGHTPSRRKPEWWGGDVPWLSLVDIRAVDGDYVFETTEYTNELGLENSSARLLPEGTVAMSRTASVGFVTIFGRSMATSQDFVNWVCSNELDPRFLMHLLLSARSYVLAIASGAIHKTIYMPAVKSFRVCIPDITEQRRIVARLDATLGQAKQVAALIDEERAELEALPAQLLRHSFGGAANGTG